MGRGKKAPGETVAASSSMGPAPGSPALPLRPCIMPAKSRHFGNSSQTELNSHHYLETGLGENNQAVGVRAQHTYCSSNGHCSPSL